VEPAASEFCQAQLMPPEQEPRPSGYRSIGMGRCVPRRGQCCRRSALQVEYRESIGSITKVLSTPPCTQTAILCNRPRRHRSDETLIDPRQNRRNCLSSVCNEAGITGLRDRGSPRARRALAKGTPVTLVISPVRRAELRAASVPCYCGARHGGKPRQSERRPSPSRMVPRPTAGEALRVEACVRT
jgi:hypothetical protein